MHRYFWRVGGVLIAFGNGARAVGIVQEQAWSAEEGVICPRAAVQNLACPPPPAGGELGPAICSPVGICLRGRMRCAIHHCQSSFCQSKTTLKLHSSLQQHRNTWLHPSTTHTFSTLGTSYICRGGACLCVYMHWQI